MSTISSSIFADKSDLSSVGRWLSSRRGKHYRQATERYSAQLCEILEQETKQKFAQINTRSTDIKIEGKLTPLTGIAVHRSILPDAQVGQRLSLINLANDQLLSTGYILNVTPTSVKIRLKQLVKAKEIGGEKNEETGEEAPAEYEDLECRIKFDQREIFDRHDCVAYALDKFRKLSGSSPIHQCLLGIYDDHSDTIQHKVRVMRFRGLPQIRDRFQRLAIEQSMRRRVSLVEGPAGSGKTLVAAYTACNMCRLKKRKILLCSPIQANVIRMARMIEQIDGMDVVQLPDPTRKAPKAAAKKSSSTSDAGSLANGYSNGHPGSNGSKNGHDGDEDYDGHGDVLECNLDKLIDDEIYWMAWRRAENVIDDHLREQHALKVVNNSSHWIRQKYGARILQKAEIVCCNLTQTGPSGPLEGVNFDMLIIDDVQVASEIDCIVPIMTRGVSQVTLLSDLRANVRLPRRSSSRLDRVSSTNSLSSNRKSKLIKRHSTALNANVDNQPESADMEPTSEQGGLFKRWLSMGISAVALNCQYRAHESLSNFTNHQFYRQPPQDDPQTNAKLTAKIRHLLRNESRWSWLPNDKCLTAIFDADTSSDLVGKQLEQIVDNLARHEDIIKGDIGIVANRRADTFRGPEGVQTGAVADWVGQEKNFIILAGLTGPQSVGAESSNGDGSAITSAIDDGQADFLFNDDLLEVGLTRARLGLFIVADLTGSKLLQQNNVVGLDNGSAGDAIQVGDQQNDANHCKSWRELVHYYQHNNLVSKLK